MNAGPNWARRYGANPRRLCARPGCGTPAAATLRFQPTRREAWLVDLDASAARTEGDLCARHAAGLVLPRGWELHNYLSADLDAGRAPETPDPGAAPVRRARGASIARARRRRASLHTMELPGLTVADAPEAIGELDPAPHDSHNDDARNGDTRDDNTEDDASSDQASGHDAPGDCTEPRPVERAGTPHVGGASPEAGVALAETLDAQTPLLRRAFSNVWLPDNGS